MGRVAALYRYPVKGLSPEALDSLDLRAGEGAPFDRVFALALATTNFDEAAPEPLAKSYFLMLMRNEQLAQLSTSVDQATGALVIRRDGQVALHASLTGAEGRRAIADFFASFLGIAAPRVVHAPGHLFTDASVDSPAMMRAVSLVNLASVRELERALGRSLDPLRFRANIYIDGLPPWAEFGWLGREIAIGPLSVRGAQRTRRCAATNVNPATAQRDENLPQALMRNFGHPDMGIYVDVLNDGRIARNDPVAAL
jgi:uncharacterized protein YcbX